MKVLLIWLWKMWQFHLNNLLQINEVKKIYAFDVFEEAFKNKNPKIQYSTKLEDFDSKDFDFVDIVAPTQFHHTYLEKYIKLNKNIFVEKPIVSSYEEIEKIEKIIKETNYSAKIWVGFIERFNVVSKFLKNIIKENNEPKLIEIFRYNPWSDRIWDVDVTTDLMIHDLDLVNYFFDWKKFEIKWKNIENSSSTVLLKVNNTSITLSANRITQQKIRQIKFYYDDKTIVWDLMSGKVDIYHKPNKYFSEAWVDLNISYLIDEKYLQKTNQLKEELEEFVNIFDWWEYKNLSNFDAWKNSINTLNELLK